VRITAESVGASKPDPEGFLKGAAELGVAPEDCVVFEDSGAGVAAGRAAGMRVVGVGARAGLHRPDAVVRDLRRVRVEVLEGGAGVRLHVG
jgi:sugar-phosphatase